MSKNLTVGYHVVACMSQDGWEMYVHHDFNCVPQTWLDEEEPLPIPAPDAYRRCAQYVQEHPEAPMPALEPVQRELTPIELAASELGSLLMGLCQRHGFDLGMSQDDINDELMRELAAFGVQDAKDG